MATVGKLPLNTKQGYSPSASGPVARPSVTAPPAPVATPPTSSFSGAPVKPRAEGAPDRGFRDVAGAYPGGLTLGNAGPGDGAVFADARDAMRQLGALALNQLQALGERMGPHYRIAAGLPSAHLAMKLAQTAQMHGDLAGLAQAFAAVRAEVPAGERPLPPAVEFPKLEASAERMALVRALSQLNPDQLDWLAVRMGLNGLGQVSGLAVPTPRMAMALVQHFERAAQLPALAAVLKRAPAELSGAEPVPGPELALAVDLSRLEEPKLRTALARAGLDVDDLGGSTRLGLALAVARRARQSGTVEALSAILPAA